MLIVHLFVSYAHVNMCHIFSSSWCQRLAATSACGSSWTILFTFLKSIVSLSTKRLDTGRILGTGWIPIPGSEHVCYTSWSAFRVIPVYESSSSSLNLFQSMDVNCKVRIPDCGGVL